MNVRRIALLGTHPPRQCGIAVFTDDLAHALVQARPEAEVLVVARLMNANMVGGGARLGRGVGSGADLVGGAVSATSNRRPERRRPHSGPCRDKFEIGHGGLHFDDDVRQQRRGDVRAPLGGQCAGSACRRPRRGRRPA